MLMAPAAMVYGAGEGESCRRWWQFGAVARNAKGELTRGAKKQNANISARPGMAIDSFDSLSMRCPKLGGSVTFGYCRRSNEGLPCSAVMGCWAGRFDVGGFLEANYSADDLRRALGTRRSRLDLIAEAVRRAKQEAEGQ